MILYKKLYFSPHASCQMKRGWDSRWMAWAVTYAFVALFSLQASARGEKRSEEKTIPPMSFFDEETRATLNLSDLLKSGSSVLFVKEDCEPCLRMLKTLKSCDFQQPLAVVAAGPALFQNQVRRLIPQSNRLLKISLESLIQSTPGTPFLILPDENTHFGTLSCSELKTKLASGIVNQKTGAKP